MTYNTLIVTLKVTHLPYHNIPDFCTYVTVETIAPSCGVVFAYCCAGMPPPSGVGIGSPMHPGGVDRKRPATDPRLAHQMKL